MLKEVMPGLNQKVRRSRNKPGEEHFSRCGVLKGKSCYKLREHLDMRDRQQEVFGK